MQLQYLHRERVYFRNRLVKVCATNGASTCRCLWSVGIFILISARLITYWLHSEFYNSYFKYMAVRIEVNRIWRNTKPNRTNNEQTNTCRYYTIPNETCHAVLPSWFHLSYSSSTIEIWVYAIYIGLPAEKRPVPAGNCADPEKRKANNE